MDKSILKSMICHAKNPHTLRIRFIWSKLRVLVWSIFLQCSFIPTISIAPLQVHFYSEVLSTQHRYCAGVSRRAPQATVCSGLAQGPYVAARAGVETTTLRLKAINSTNAPPCPNVQQEPRTASCGTNG